MSLSNRFVLVQTVLFASFAIIVNGNMCMPAVLGYWKLRGLGQHIRLLLEYTETDYTDKQYEFGPPPTYDWGQWTTDKYNLGLELPNLPYYIDGPHKITQSNAIMRYIARKHNLVGKTEEEIIRVDMYENQAMDYRMAWAKLVYDPDNFEANKETYIKETLPAALKLLNNCKHKWFAGDNLTFVDFVLYELCDINRLLAPGCLDGYPNIKDFVARFEALPQIKKYMSSPRFLKNPINGFNAAFGS